MLPQNLKIKIAGYYSLVSSFYTDIICEHLQALIRLPPEKGRDTFCSVHDQKGIYPILKETKVKVLLSQWQSIGGVSIQNLHEFILAVNAISVQIQIHGSQNNFLQEKFRMKSRSFNKSERPLQQKAES